MAYLAWRGGANQQQQQQPGAARLPLRDNVFLAAAPQLSGLPPQQQQQPVSNRPGPCMRLAVPRVQVLAASDTARHGEGSAEAHPAALRRQLDGIQPGLARPRPARDGDKVGREQALPVHCQHCQHRRHRQTKGKPRQKRNDWSDTPAGRESSGTLSSREETKIIDHPKKHTLRCAHSTKCFLGIQEIPLKTHKKDRNPRIPTKRFHRVQASFSILHGERPAGPSTRTRPQPDEQRLAKSATGPECFYLHAMPDGGARFALRARPSSSSGRDGGTGGRYTVGS